MNESTATDTDTQRCRYRKKNKKNKKLTISFYHIANNVFNTLQFELLIINSGFKRQIEVVLTADEDEPELSPLCITRTLHLTLTFLCFTPN